MFFKSKAPSTPDQRERRTKQRTKNEIEVLSWSWGIQGRFVSRRRRGEPARPRCGTADRQEVDKASTALMSALRTNEAIKEATLTLRKTGGSKLEYLKITIQDGRVTAPRHRGRRSQRQRDAAREVSFTFNKISVRITHRRAATACHRARRRSKTRGGEQLRRNHAGKDAAESA